jgi:UDP-N-acetyl-D-galactosamine dehydrogenase
MKVDVYDPWADQEDVKSEFDIEMISELKGSFDAIVHVVAHNEFLDLDFSKLKEQNSVVYDVKGSLPKHLITSRL